MNDNSLGAKCKQMYEMSLKNLEGPNPDLADEVIVVLWRAVEALTLQQSEQQDDFKTYSTSEQQKRLCDYYQQVAILETRLAEAVKERDELKYRLEGLEK